MNASLMVLGAWFTVPLWMVALEGLQKARKRRLERLADAPRLSAPPNLTCAVRRTHELQD